MEVSSLVMPCAASSMLSRSLSPIPPRRSPELSEKAVLLSATLADLTPRLRSFCCESGWILTFRDQCSSVNDQEYSSM